MIQENRQNSIDETRLDAARGLVQLAGGYLIASASTKPVPLQLALARDQVIVTASILAGLQILYATHGEDGLALAACALDAGRAGSPTLLLSAIDLAWARVAGAEFTIGRSEIVRFSRLSKRVAAVESQLDRDFSGYVITAAEASRKSFSPRRAAYGDAKTGPHYPQEVSVVDPALEAALDALNGPSSSSSAPDLS